MLCLIISFSFSRSTKINKRNVSSMQCLCSLVLGSGCFLYQSKSCLCTADFIGFLSLLGAVGMGAVLLYPYTRTFYMILGLEYTKAEGTNGNIVHLC